MNKVIFTARKDASEPDGIPVAQLDKTGTLIVEIADSPYQLVISIPKGRDDRKKGAPTFTLSVKTSVIPDHEGAGKVKAGFGQEYILAPSGALVIAAQSTGAAPAATEPPAPVEEAPASSEGGEGEEQPAAPAAQPEGAAS